MAGDALPAWLRPFTWSDVLLTWVRGLSGGRVPYWDSYFEYPPLIGYASGLFSIATPTAFAYVAMWAVVQIAVGAAIALVLVRAGAGRRAWAWALAPELALFGPMNFDLLAILAVVLAVYGERLNAPLRSVTALALGTAAKLFPAAALPVVVLRRWSRDRGTAALASALFGALLAACYAPAAAAPFSSLESVGRYSVGVVANFDSIWGAIAGVLDGVGMPSVAPILVVTTVGLAATYVFGVLPLARTARDPAVPIALAVLSVLLWSRLYSPQYSLWVLPFFALLPLRRRVFALLVSADVGVFFTVYPLTLTQRPTGDALGAMLLALLTVAIVVRHAALVVWWIEVRRLAAPPTGSPLRG